MIVNKVFKRLAGLSILPLILLSSSDFGTAQSWWNEYNEFSAMPISEDGKNTALPFEINFNNCNRYVFGDSIKEYEFYREERTDLKKEGCYEDYFKFKTYNENREKVLINCWDTPEGTDPTEYVQTIIEYYLAKRKIPEPEKKTADELFKEEIEEEQKISKEAKIISGYSYDLNPDITESMVNNVAHLIERPSSVTIDWLCAVTRYEKEIVEEIITMHLGLLIENGKVLK